MLGRVTAAATALIAAAAVAVPAPAAAALPDGRGWEMVSPVEKNGGEVQAPGEIFGGGLVQAAAAGSAVTYSSRASFADPLAASSASQYVSRRGAGGWATENVTTPSQAGAFGEELDGVPYRAFSTDLSRALIADPERCEAGPCPRALLLRQSAGGALAAFPGQADLALAGASPDLGAAVLSTCAALSPDATEEPGEGGGCDPAAANLYRWSGSSPQLLNLLPGHSSGTPGAALAAPAGAVSADGSRVYFTLAGDLYLRQAGGTSQVDEAAGGGGTFETASTDGGIAFFTKAGHLYRYAAASGVATDLTPAGGVQGVLGASPDGSYLYYRTAAGLYLSHAGATIAVAAAADPGNSPPATGTARVAADGTLAFLSSASLGGAYTHGFAAVYRYAPASATLTCVSCKPSGAPATAAATIPGAPANGSAQLYKPRALSADGTRIFFETSQSLQATEDSNGVGDVYEWEAGGAGSCARPAGCLGLISSGRSGEPASFLDASADGADAFFLTAGSLVAGDPGGADVYDARIGGGFPVPAAPIACLADACQAVPGEPEDPTPGTAYYRPEGNPPLRWGGRSAKAAAKRKAARRRAAKRRAAARRRAARRRAAKKRTAAAKRTAGRRGGRR